MSTASYSEHGGDAPPIDRPRDHGRDVVDVIPATNSPYHTTNIEDGIALADETLRQSLAQQYPDAWARIQRRRTFMRDALGIRLKPEVLPFSYIPAYLPPFWLSPQRAMRLA
jgi:hypothetical protein